MLAYDALNGRQPDPGTWEFPGIVESLKCPKQLVRVGHVEANAIIPNKECGFAVGNALSEFNLRGRSITGKLPGVTDEVLQRNSQKPGVPLCDQIGRYHHLHISPGATFEKPIHNALRRQTEVDGTNL